MDAMSFPPVWPEEQRFSPPPSLFSTDSPSLPDDVITLLATPSHLKQTLQKISLTIKQYFLPPRAAYPYWSAYTPTHIKPDAVESHGPGKSFRTSRPMVLTA